MHIDPTGVKQTQIDSCRIIAQNIPRPVVFRKSGAENHLGSILIILFIYIALRAAGCQNQRDSQKKRKRESIFFSFHNLYIVTFRGEKYKPRRSHGDRACDYVPADLQIAVLIRT